MPQAKTSRDNVTRSQDLGRERQDLGTWGERERDKTRSKGQRHVSDLFRDFLQILSGKHAEKAPRKVQRLVNRSVFVHALVDKFILEPVRTDRQTDSG
jgi:hypothetical protein